MLPDLTCRWLHLFGKPVEGVLSTAAAPGKPWYFSGDWFWVHFSFVVIAAHLREKTGK
jgi:hypothetical protein